jgi:DoxX-like family
MRIMDVAYWIVAGFLALFYLYAGGKKVIQTREQLQPMMGWVDSTPMPAVRSIGVLEVLGAIGLILPPLTGIAPWLALAAAIGFVLLQIGATTVHLRRGEARLIGLNIGLIIVAAATVWLATTWL